MELKPVLVSYTETYYLQGDEEKSLVYQLVYLPDIYIEKYRRGTKEPLMSQARSAIWKKYEHSTITGFVLETVELETIFW